MEVLKLSKSFSSKNELPNTNFVVTVLFILLKENPGKKINTEDIAFKCFQMAPQKFCWKTKPDLPDIEPARRGLMIARNKHQWVYGHRASDIVKEGWSLTDIGIIEAKKYLNLLVADEPLMAENNKNQYIIKYLSRIKQNKFFKLFLNEQIEENLSIFKFHDLSTLLETSPNKVRVNERFQDTINYASTYGESDILLFLNYLKDHFPEFIDRNILIKAHTKTEKAKNKIERI